MDKSYIRSYLTLFLVFEILISSTLAATDRLDVETLNDLYENFGRPSQLIGWKSDGGDPCEDSWIGVSCNGTSVIYIELRGLGLSGQLGESFYLQNLKQLDLSFNYIQGEIPSYLPLNLTYLDLSCNNFSMNIPYSLAFVKHLHHLNLSHNFLSGTVGNLFTSMQNLRRMDLSYNSLSGDLPSSFANLTNVTDLYLQENKFTGSVIFLAHLHLTILNIENNNFSGVLPKQFQDVPNLWIGGNRFQFGSGYPAWDFPQDSIPSSPPATKSNSIENYPSRSVKKEKRRSPVVLVSALAGLSLAATCVAIFMVLRFKRRRVNNLQNLDNDGGFQGIKTLSDFHMGQMKLMMIEPELPTKVDVGPIVATSVQAQSSSSGATKMLVLKDKEATTALAITIPQLEVHEITVSEWAGFYFLCSEGDWCMLANNSKQLLYVNPFTEEVISVEEVPATFRGVPVMDMKGSFVGVPDLAFLPDATLIMLTHTHQLFVLYKRGSAKWISHLVDTTGFLRVDIASPIIGFNKVYWLSNSATVEYLSLNLEHKNVMINQLVGVEGKRTMFFYNGELYILVCTTTRNPLLLQVDPSLTFVKVIHNLPTTVFAVAGGQGSAECFGDANELYMACTNGWHLVVHRCSHVQKELFCSNCGHSAVWISSD